MNAGSGLIQTFDVNGKFLWKRMFSKLVHFEWRKFLIIPELTENAINEYDSLVEEIENEDEELKQMYEAQEKENIEEQVKQWKEFLEKRRNEILTFKMENLLK